MGIFDFLKPKWQRSDPNVRKAVVAGLRDQAILENLAKGDPDESVRQAARKRLDSLREAAFNRLAEQKAQRVRALATQLRSEDMGAREKALEELASIATEEATGEALRATCIAQLADALRGKTDLARAAAKLVMDMRAEHPEITSELDPDMHDAVRCAFEEVCELIRKGDRVSEDAMLQLVAFGNFARDYTGNLRTEMDKAGKRAKNNPWLIGTLACIAADPKPYFVKLLEPMRKADEGQGPAPICIRPGGGIQVFGGPLGDALTYISAWSANSPAMNSQEALKRALSLLGDAGREQLLALREQYPSQVDKVLSEEEA